LDGRTFGFVLDRELSLPPPASDEVRSVSAEFTIGPKPEWH